MSTRTFEARELLDIILEKAPKLRAAGVQGVEIDGLKFALAAPEPDFTGDKAADDESEDDGMLSPLDDPRTFGKRPKPATKNADKP